MEFLDFIKVKNEFSKSNVDKKIEIYATTEGLTQEQYKELLRDFPLNEINKLEAALK